MGLTKQDIELLSEAIVRKIHRDLPSIVEKCLIANEKDEYMCLKEAAARLKMSPSTLYKNKDNIGGFTRINNRIVFSKIRIEEYIRKSLVG